MGTILKAIEAIGLTSLVLYGRCYTLFDPFYAWTPKGSELCFKLWAHQPKCCFFKLGEVIRTSQEKGNPHYRHLHYSAGAMLYLPPSMDGLQRGPSYVSYLQPKCFFKLVAHQPLVQLIRTPQKEGSPHYLTPCIIRPLSWMDSKGVRTMIYTWGLLDQEFTQTWGSLALNQGDCTRPRVYSTTLIQFSDTLRRRRCPYLASVYQAKIQLYSTIPKNFILTS